MKLAELIEGLSIEAIQGSASAEITGIAESARAAEGMLATQVVPPGAIAPFGGDAAMIPGGWLLCDGDGFSIADQPDLFAAIGTSWGDGPDDGTCQSTPSCDFNLPDLRGTFLRGLDPATGRTIGDPQNYATALPVTPFSTTPAGAHDHSVDIVNFALEGEEAPKAKPKESSELIKLKAEIAILNHWKAFGKKNLSKKLSAANKKLKTLNAKGSNNEG